MCFQPACLFYGAASMLHALLALCFVSHPNDMPNHGYYTVLSAYSEFCILDFLGLPHILSEIAPARDICDA